MIEGERKIIINPKRIIREGAAKRVITIVSDDVQPVFERRPMGWKKYPQTIAPKTIEAYFTPVLSEEDYTRFVTRLNSDESERK